MWKVLLSVGGFLWKNKWTAATVAGIYDGVSNNGKWSGKLVGKLNDWMFGKDEKDQKKTAENQTDDENENELLKQGGNLLSNVKDSAVDKATKSLGIDEETLGIFGKIGDFFKGLMKGPFGWITGLAAGAGALMGSGPLGKTWNAVKFAAIALGVTKLIDLVSGGAVTKFFNKTFNKTEAIENDTSPSTPGVETPKVTPELKTEYKNTQAYVPRVEEPATSTNTFNDRASESIIPDDKMTQAGVAVTEEQQVRVDERLHDEFNVISSRKLGSKTPKPGTASEHMAFANTTGRPVSGALVEEIQERLTAENTINERPQPELALDEIT